MKNERGVGEELSHIVLDEMHEMDMDMAFVLVRLFPLRFRAGNWCATCELTPLLPAAIRSSSSGFLKVSSICKE